MQCSLAWLFSLHGKVSQRDYLLAGALLMLVKYAGEVLILYLGSAQLLMPWQFADPLLGDRLALYGRVGTGVLAIWSLPFLWAGVSLSCRRAVDGGFSEWVGVLFVIPVLGWLVILVLLLAPARPKLSSAAPEVDPSEPDANDASDASLACTPAALAGADGSGRRELLDRIRHDGPVRLCPASLWHRAVRS